MTTRSTEELGRLIARAHYQAWRTDAPPFDLTVEELAAILPNLIRSGSAGIVWHRVKPSREKYGALALALEAATDAQIAHNQKVEEAVVECVTRLRAHGIEPVLVKGLAIAKFYPEGIVRPAGDIDLVVRKEEFAAAHAILHDTTRERITTAIDLHRPEPSPPDAGAWDEVPNADFWNRTESMRVGSAAARVLGPTDNLLMACYHFVKHGGQRPLWLCDLSLLHSLTNDTGQKYTVRDDNWLDMLQRLAAQLIGGPPTPLGAPDWLVETVLDQWVNPRSISSEGALRAVLAKPSRTVAILKDRWPTALTALFRRKSLVEDHPPISDQLLEFTRRFRRLAKCHIQLHSLIFY